MLVGTVAGCAAAGPSASPVSRVTDRGRVHAAYPPRDLQTVRPQTRAERGGFTETSRHADVMAFIDSLRTASRNIHVLTMGKTSEGRDIPLVILSRPLVRSAAEAKRLNRPIVYIQANIHGGEVEGKEALLSVLRDLERDPYQNAADSVVIVAAPIYNADGNEAFAAQEQNREDQNGPALVGRRANSQGLDLNRDYIKAEAPETRAALDFFRDWSPDVFIDLHTTNGSYHGYGLTWAPPLNPAAHFSGAYTRDTLLPEVRTRLATMQRIETFPYGNFISQDSVARGWFTYDHRPRFGTNYYGLRGRIAILSEAYSHDPFQKRIASTYGFLKEVLSVLSRDAEDILEVGKEADRRTTGFASVPGLSPLIAIRSRVTAKPRMEYVAVEEIVRTGDSARTEAGLPPGLRRSGRVRRERVPVYDRFDPSLSQTLPYAWAIPADLGALLEPLRRHGVYVEQLGANAVVRGERFAIDSVVQSPRTFQGHRETRVVGRWTPPDSLALAAGSYVVRGGQPMGILALYLLDAQSDDGLVTWNFLDPRLAAGGFFPVARVLDRIPAALQPAREP
jgi:hypothetical protein